MNLENKKQHDANIKCLKRFFKQEPVEENIAQRGYLVGFVDDITCAMN